MFHTHAPLPRGFFMEITHGEGLLSVPWSRKWLQNTRKEGNELAKRLSRRSWCQSSMSDRASICIMLRQSLGRSCQVAGKVGQVFRRENLTRISGQVGLVRFNLLKDRCIGFSVIAENVVQDTQQFLDLTWNRQCADVGRVGCVVIHHRVTVGLLVIRCLISIFRRLPRLVPMLVVVIRHWNAVETTPVIGKASGLLPAIYVASIFCSDMTNDSIEEVLRLPVSFFSMTIYFCHYQAVWCVWARWRYDLREDVSM